MNIIPQHRSSKRKGKVIMMPSLNKSRYISTEDVARLLGFSVRTITAWAAAWHESGGTEGLPAFKMGRSWRFDPEEIQALIRRQKQPPERKAATT